MKSKRVKFNLYNHYKFEKMSGLDNIEKTCKDAVVKVPEPWHIVCFVLNIFIPGCGTVISAFMGPDG